jgi:hypothetical protein
MNPVIHHIHPQLHSHPPSSIPVAKVKFLAAEALRGVGGIVLDALGNRFCNELGRRDYVTGAAWRSLGGWVVGPLGLSMDLMGFYSDLMGFYSDLMGYTLW